jgi:hypothetical protein
MRLSCIGWVFDALRAVGKEGAVEQRQLADRLVFAVAVVDTLGVDRRPAVLVDKY